MQLGYFIQAQATKLFLLVFKLAGLRGGSWLGSLLGVFLGKIVKERQIAEDNLHQAMPTLSKAEREQILNKCWRQLGRVIGEFPHMKKIAREAEARIIIEGKENVDAVLSTGGPALFLSGHFSNWEVMMLGIKRVAGDSGAIYRRANNPVIEKWVKKQRGTFETTQITKGRNGTREMIEL